MIDLNGLVPERTDGLLERNLGDATVVLAEDGEMLHTLKGSALLLWNMIDGKNSFEALSRRMTEEYEVESARASSDLRAFLRSLEDSGLIKKERDLNHAL